MPKLTDGQRIARTMFDAAYLRWRRDGWRVRLVPGTGYREALQGQVREPDRTVLLYPDQAEMPLPELLFHEWAHVLTDLNNFPPAEHLCVEQLVKLAFPQIGLRREAILRRIIARADQNGHPADPARKEKSRS